MKLSPPLLRYLLRLAVTGLTARTLPVSEPYEFRVVVDAAIASDSRVTLAHAPVLGDMWEGGVVIAPRDADARAIDCGADKRACPNADELAIALYQPTAEDGSGHRRLAAADASCGVGIADWDSGTKTFLVSCAIPDVASRAAGMWTLEVLLAGVDFYSELVHMQCPAGQYEGAGSKCVACPAGVDCELPGVTIENFDLDNDYYRYIDPDNDPPYYSVVVRECPGDGCKGEHGDGPDGYCRAGHEKPLCAVCSAGYYRFGGECRECARATAAAPWWLAVVAVAALAFFVLRHPRVLPAWEFVWSHSLSTQAKIAWSAGQILAQFPTLLSRSDMPEFLKRFYASLDVVNLDPLVGLSLSCWFGRIGFFSRLLFATLAPLGVAAVIALSYARCIARVSAAAAPAARGRKKYVEEEAIEVKEQRRLAAARHLHALLLLLYFVLPSVCSTIFTTFLCDDDFGSDAPIKGFDRGFLRADYAVSCASAHYRHIKVYAYCCLLVYPVGVPCLYIAILARSRRDITTHMASAADRVHGKVGAPPRKGASDAERAAHEAVEPILFLFDAYHAGAFFFEPIDVSRRVLLTGFLVFFGEQARVAVASLIAFVFVLLYANYRPFARADDQQLSGLANATIAFTLLTLLCAQANAFNARALSVLCAVATVGVLSAIIALQLRRARQRSTMMRALSMGRTMSRRSSFSSSFGPTSLPKTLSRGLSKSAALWPMQGPDGDGAGGDGGHFDENIEEEEFARTFADVYEAGPYARRDLLERLFEWFRTQLEIKPLTQERWQELMIMLHAIRPYEADGDVRHGLAFRTDDGAEHVGYIEDGAVDGAPAMLKFCSCDHSAAEVLSRSSRDATLEFAYKGKRVSVAYTASLLDGVKAVAWEQAREYVEQAKQTVTDKLELASKEASDRINKLPDRFGTVRAELPKSFMPLMRELVPKCALFDADSTGARFADTLDADVGVIAMHCVAEVALKRFSARLRELFPHARVVSDVEAMRDDDEFVLLIAPVKCSARVRAKVREAALMAGNDEEKMKRQWPFVTTIGDFLRASVVCNDIDALDRAWASVRDGFKVCDGHGRLKNHLRTKEERPPDMLVNVVLDGAGAPPATAEIQIHLREVLSLKEAVIHRMYELIRAKDIGALLEEEKSKHVQHELKKSRTVVRRINAALHGDADHERDGSSAARDSTPADGSSARRGHFPSSTPAQFPLGSPTPTSPDTETPGVDVETPATKPVMDV